MNIQKQLLVEHSKANAKKIAKYIGESKWRLAELMDCFFCNHYRVNQRSAMVVSEIFDKNPRLLEPFKKKIILQLIEEELEVAVKRNSIRILQFQKIPEELTAPLFDCCLKFLRDTKEPIAIKAFSMTVLFNICKRFPELKSELIPILEGELNQNESKGIQSRGKKVLKQLRMLKH
ncbi:MAG: hypothetical protein RJQ00_06945 [Vicingaceae bacterium]